MLGLMQISILHKQVNFFVTSSFASFTIFHLNVVKL